MSRIVNISLAVFFAITILCSMSENIKQSLKEFGGQVSYASILLIPMPPPPKIKGC